MEIITQPWPWYVAGPAIAFVLFLLFFFGRSFGVSSNLETFCTLGGAGKFVDYFKIDWKARTWSLVFVTGIIIGGFVSFHYLMPSQAIDLNPKTVQELAELGFANAGTEYLPAEIFSTDNLLSLAPLKVSQFSMSLAWYRLRRTSKVVKLKIRKCQDNPVHIG